LRICFKAGFEPAKSKMMGSTKSPGAILDSVAGPSEARVSLMDETNISRLRAT
jgi:hypothetical protein